MNCVEILVHIPKFVLLKTIANEKKKLGQVFIYTRYDRVIKSQIGLKTSLSHVLGEKARGHINVIEKWIENGWAFMMKNFASGRYGGFKWILF